LVTNAGLEVLEGGEGTINSSRLMVTDPDTEPDDLIYMTDTLPMNGILLVSGLPDDTFSQADINAGMVTYRHDGSNTSTDSFVFEVTDGVNTTGMQTFNIAINLSAKFNVFLDKPKEVIKNKDKVKLEGYIGGLEKGKKYIIFIQVFEDGGIAKSAPLYKKFTVIDK
jgi:hypothetical protein